MVCGRGNVDNAILDQLKQIIARLYVVEIGQRRGEHFDDVSDDEAETPNHNLEAKEDQDEERLLRVLSRKNSKPSIEVVLMMKNWIPMLCWIGSQMEKFFEYENTPHNRKVKIVVTRLKGHASL